MTIFVNISIDVVYRLNLLCPFILTNQALASLFSNEIRQYAAKWLY